MGGDQFNQLISEYLSKNGGFIAFMIVIMSLCVLAVIAGVILHFVMNARAPKPVEAAPAPVAETTKKVEPAPAVKEVAKTVEKEAPATKKAAATTKAPATKKAAAKKTTKE